uniref:Uncharacterized protein n=1 Tax=Tanacetum cinerariifolium TaxID=118510 RepID=A0A699K268_TANCI|nr:hypothetical protein [Tanacetum cinerariifolium]
MTGNYMPSEPDVEIDYSKFTYGPKQTSADESDSKPIWNAAPIIEEYESDSDNDSVSNVQEDKEKPSFAFTNSVKHVKTSRENIKETSTTNHNPKIEKHDRNGHTRKGLGYAFTRKACFIWGSFSHLIRDSNFHEKRMAKHAELTKSKNKDKGIVDSGCSRNMTRNKAHLIDYQEFKGASVAFEGSNGRITGKRKIKTDSTGQQQLSTARHKASTAGIKKIEENAQFHEIVDFLSRSLIFYARTISPDVCASFIEQFWKTATFKTINNIIQINAKVAGKPVVITEASIRGGLLFNDVDGIDCLTNKAIFDNLALMGYEGDLTKLTFQKALFSP